ncbi:MAG: 4-alpha-glucanotransferase [Acidobacteriota bacterium]
MTLRRHSVLSSRRAGILLHPTSLPGPFGIGDLGPSALRFLFWLRDAGQSVWQLLPLGPTGLGNSPYGALSGLAGNPLLISPDWLEWNDLLEPEEVTACHFHGAVDYARAGALKDRLLRQAHGRWLKLDRQDSRRLRVERAMEEQGPWLEEWCLFAALKDSLGGRSWLEWDGALRDRDPTALADARQRLAEEISFHRTCQGFFALQWNRLRRVAKSLGITLFGDLPIYPALDSVEVWANPRLFDLDEKGRPRAISGVPPDDFSDDGQLWGSPIYRWERLAEEGYRWWTERVEGALRRVDLLRLDHFRGFEAYWAVPADADSAAEGEWRPGPGRALFEALAADLGHLPLVAEDLGVITPEVEELRDSLGLPGMRVLQFAFDEPESVHLPHAAPKRSVAYTGTHDNDTSEGWFASLPAERQRTVQTYLRTEGGEPIAWAMLRAIYASPARLAIAPFQDLLELGSEARINTPGKGSGNWSWRLAGLYPWREASGPRLRALTESAGRLAAFGG